MKLATANLYINLEMGMHFLLFPHLIRPSVFCRPRYLSLLEGRPQISQDLTKMSAVAKLSQTLITKARPHIATSIKYAKAELTPPKISDLPQVTAGINQLLRGFRTGSWKQLTVKEAWLNVLVATEVACWFFIGECIGKRHFVGYKV